MVKRVLTLSVLAGLLSSKSNAQQLKLGRNPTQIEKSALLELNSTNQGLLLPRITDTAAINALSPKDGTLIFFEPNKSLYIRQNGAWIKLIVSAESTSPNGPAGGDLNGTYPNPVIASNAVTNSKLADNAVTTSKVADGAVTGDKLSTTGVTGGTYGSGTQVASINVDSKGRIVSAANASIAFPVTSVNGQTGAVTISSAAPSGAAGGDLTGTYPNPTINNNAIVTAKLNNGAVTYGKIQNVTGNRLLGRIGTAGTAQEIDLGTGLSFSGTSLTVTGAAPTGAAGGDLSGTYPNPTIANSAITNAKLATDAVNTAQLVNGAVTLDKVQTINDNRLLGRVAGAGSGAPVQLSFGTGFGFTGNTLNVVGAAPTGSAGGDLSGSFPNPTIAAAAIGTTKLADGAVTDGKLADGSVISAKLGNQAVTFGKLQNINTSRLIGRSTAGTGSAEEIQLGTGLSLSGGTLNTVNNGTVTSVGIASTDLSVTGGPVTNSGNITVNLPTLITSPGSYGSSTQVPVISVDSKGRISSVSTASINALTTTLSNGNFLVGNASNVATAVTMSGDATLANTGALTIANDAITNAKLADNAVNTAELANGAVTFGKMQNIAGARLIGRPGTTSGAAQEISLGTGLSLSTGGVLSATAASPSGAAGGDLTGNYPNPGIANSAVTNSKISNGAITTDKIAAAAVGTTEIANDAVTLTKIQNIAANRFIGRVPGLGLAGSAQELTFGTGFSFIGTTVNISSAAPTGNAGGDLSGTYPNPDIATAAVTTGKIANNAVQYSKIQNVTANRILGRSSGLSGTVEELTLGSGLQLSLTGVLSTTGAAPTGNAGGDLTGTYPNPTIAAGAVTTGKLNDGAVTTAKMDDGAVTGTKIATNTVALSNLVQQPASTLLGRNSAGAGNAQQITLGTGLAMSTGGVLSVNGAAPTGNAGGDLTGTYPNPAVAANAITNSKIADNAVTTGKILNGTILGEDIADGTIALLEMQNRNASTLIGRSNSGAGVPQEITLGTGLSMSAGGVLSTSGAAPTGAAGGDLTGNYPNPTVAGSAINTAKLADDAVATAKIANSAVTYAKLQNVTGSRLLGRSATTAGTAQEISLGAGLSLNSGTGVLSASGTGTTLNSGQILLGNSSNVAAAVTPGGAATISNTGVISLSAGSVGTNEVADGSITGTDIAANSITADKFQIIPTGILIGRSTAGFGNVENVNIGTGLSLAGGALSAVNNGTVTSVGIASTDLTVSGGPVTASGNITVNLPNALGSTPGSYGSSSQVPVINVDAKGRITSVTTAAISAMSNTLSSGNLFVGNASNVATGVAMSGDATLANTGALTIANNAVTNTKIASGTIALDRMANVASGTLIGRGAAGAGAPQAVTLGTGLALSTGNVLSTSGLQSNTLASANLWVGNGSGQATAVPVSGDLTLANTGALTINAGAVVTNDLADGAATTAKIADGAATTAKIGNQAVTYAKLQNVTGARLLGRSNSGTGSAEEITLGTGLSFTGTTLNVTGGGGSPSGNAGGDLTGTYPNPTLTTTGASAGSYGTASQVPVVTIDAKGRVTNIYHTPIQAAPFGSAGGDLSGNYPNPQIGGGKVTNYHILDGTIQTTDLADGILTNAKYQNYSITQDKLQNDIIGTNQIANGAVGNLDIADAAVGTSKIADNAVTTAKILDKAVTLDKMADATANAFLVSNSGSRPVWQDQNTLLNTNTIRNQTTVQAGANFNVGGTGTMTNAAITSLSTGSVPFIGNNGAVNQDNANLYYDDNNNRLGVGTNAPGANLQVNGSFRLGSATSSTGTPQYIFSGMFKTQVGSTVNWNFNYTTSTTVTYTVNGVKSGATVMVNPQGALPSVNGTGAIAIAWARSSADNTIQVNYVNVGNAINQTSYVALDVTIIQ